MALLLNGTTQYFQTSVNNTLFSTITTAITLMTWVYFNAATTTQSFLAKFSSGTSYSFGLGLSSTSPTCNITTNSGNTNSVSLTDVVTGTWYHLAGTWDSTSQNIKIYLNGVLNTTTARAGTSIAQTTGTVLGIGAALQSTLNTTPTYFVNGRLEDVRVYNRLLAPEEIQTIAATNGRDNIVTNLLLRYPLDEGSPGTTASTTTIIDQSTSKLGIGSVTGTPTYTTGFASPVRRPINAA